jgi:hypothetical protein
LNTPGGVPASSRIPVKLRAFRGAISFDFSTAVQPASGAAATRLRSFLSLAPSLGLRGICLATTGRAALAEANQPLQRELVHDAVFSYAAGPDTINRGLDAGTVFRGVQAGSDLIALGAMAALHDRGLRVPEDVGVIGFGNADRTAHVRLAMTTLSVHHEATAIAVRSAFESMETGGDVPMLVTIARSLIIRQSA